MDWMHLLEGGLTLACGGWAAVERARAQAKAKAAKIALEAKRAAEIARQAAFQAAMQAFSDALRRHTNGIGALIGGKVPGLAGVSLLDELEAKHDAAVQEGKRLAIEEWERGAAQGPPPGVPTSERDTQPLRTPPTIGPGL